VGFFNLEDIEDDRRPITRAQLSAILKKHNVRLSRNMGRNMRTLTRYHTHPGPAGLGQIVPVAKRPRRHTDVPLSGWEPDGDDEELGFLGALASIAAPILGPVLGGLMGGGAAPPPPPPAAAAPPAPVIIPGGGGGGGYSGPPAPSLAAISGAVSDQIRAVPPPVRQQVTDAIRESMDRMKAGQATAQDMMADIQKLLGPSLQAQLSNVNKAAMQRQATFEHQSLVSRDKRWEANAKAQSRIMARLEAMEHSLGNAVVGATNRRVAVAKAFGVPPRLR